MEGKFSSPNKFCRVCLVPDESNSFDSIFAENGKMAYIIHSLSGAVLLDIDRKTPSLICNSCSKELSSVERLKMRILDAEEYYSMMTSQNEKNFINSIVVNENYQTPSQTPITRQVIDHAYAIDKSLGKSEIDKMVKENISLKINENTRKRKLEDDVDDFATPSPPLKRTKSSSAKQSILSQATPERFGIHRMIIGKSNKSLAKNTSVGNQKISGSLKKTSPSETPKSSKTKKTFVPKLNVSKKRGGKFESITFECNSCSENFVTREKLDKHQKVHDEE